MAMGLSSERMPRDGCMVGLRRGWSGVQRRWSGVTSHPKMGGREARTSPVTTPVRLTTFHIWWVGRPWRPARRGRFWHRCGPAKASNPCGAGHTFDQHQHSSVRSLGRSHVRRRRSGHQRPIESDARRPQCRPAMLDGDARLAARGAVRARSRDIRDAAVAADAGGVNFCRIFNVGRRRSILRTRRRRRRRLDDDARGGPLRRRAVSEPLRRRRERLVARGRAAGGGGGSVAGRLWRHGRARRARRRATPRCRPPAENPDRHAAAAAAAQRPRPRAAAGKAATRSLCAQRRGRPPPRTTRRPHEAGVEAAAAAAAGARAGAPTDEAGAAAAVGRRGPRAPCGRRRMRVDGGRR